MGITGRVVVGVVLLAIGFGILLDRLGHLDFSASIATYWPLILILIGILQLATRTAPAFIGLLLIVLGSFFLARNLDLIPPGWTAYILPGVLILIGLLVLIGPLVRRKRRTRKTKDARTQDTTSQGWLERSVVFGGYDTTSRADPFRGGEVTAIFGAVHLDLKNARLAPEGADLETTALFGGIEIVVPKKWRVETTGTPILGGIESKALEPENADAPVLRIDATSILGGIEIRNPK